MCFHSQQSKSATELQHRFKAKFRKIDDYKAGIYNGFTYPRTPIITHKYPDSIELFEWGLIPHWSKDINIRKNTLNARVESIDEKPSFRDVVSQRCLVLADAFFEWQWLDAAGKQKKKYKIGMSGEEAYAYAGLWSKWEDPTTKTIHLSYTILTTEANLLMAEIHNSKKRMPLIVAKESENAWLNGEDVHWDNERLVVLAE